MEINMVYVIHSLLWPLIACLFWWWNEIWYATPVRARCKSLNAKLPPGHLGIPIFGEYFTFLWYFHFLRRPDRYITSKMDKYGRNNVGAYTTFLYGSPAIIACSPSLCKKILTATTGFKQGWPSSEVLGPHSVITIHGSRHQHIKGLLASEFNHRDSLTWVALQFQPCIVAALESWFQMGRINTFYQIKRVALEFMGRYMGGLELGPEINDLENLFSTVNEGVRAQPWNFPGTPFRHALQCRKKLTEKLTVELMKKKREGNKMGATSDMMDRLMQSKDKEGRHLSNEEVVDNVLSNIAISYIGIAYPVTWCMYFLAKNPHVLQKLREENMEMAREKNGVAVTYEDFPKLKYTNKVVEETIRMASISGFIFKKATEDIKFEGYLIPKGWNVLVWLRFLHIDPSNFEDPLTFNPDRWDEENMEMAREKNGVAVTYEDFPKLKYTNKVVEETIRMASISGFIFKKATEDIKFEGYLIPKGWNVLVWLRFLHIDPSNFEDPLTFNPDRWDSLPKYGTYLPFGGGARTCPGSTMARLITVLFLHHLAIGYRWELANPDMIIIYLSHPVPADGVEVSFSKI